MNDRIICTTEQVKTNFITLEMEKDCSEYGVSIDGEIIVSNRKKEIAGKNYDIVKKNVLNGGYIREGIIQD